MIDALNDGKMMLALLALFFLPEIVVVTAVSKNDV